MLTLGETLATSTAIRYGGASLVVVAATTVLLPFRANINATTVALALTYLRRNSSCWSSLSATPEKSSRAVSCSPKSGAELHRPD